MSKIIFLIRKLIASVQNTSMPIPTHHPFKGKRAGGKGEEKRKEDKDKVQKGKRRLDAIFVSQPLKSTDNSLEICITVPLFHPWQKLSVDWACLSPHDPSVPCGYASMSGRRKIAFTMILWLLTDAKKVSEHTQ